MDIKRSGSQHFAKGSAADFTARQYLSRRGFFNTALIAAVLAVSPACTSARHQEINNQSDKGLRGRENKMNTRKLGKLEVSEMGAGCMSISANYGPPQIETKAFRSFAQPMNKA